MAHRTALCPRFQPIRRCQNELCNRVIDDVRVEADGIWRTVPSYKTRQFCSRKCIWNAMEVGAPLWMRIHYPDYRPPVDPSD